MQRERTEQHARSVADCESEIEQLVALLWPLDHRVAVVVVVGVGVLGVVLGWIA
jgi:hypothetical protein